MSKNLLIKLDITKSFKEMNEMERKLFLTYLSEHILTSEEKFTQVANLLWKWHQTNPVSTVFNASLEELFKEQN